ncbi:GDP-mannose-dependent alpha-mannosyltransferase [Siccirubricoccus deserti]|uniref:Glycosyltransferase family 1 protein n=1 Tax=Siccirubricoccus deserti TaxID=2013562 RepID=A0A9X0UF59_9PROT|nr:glycosyltransferase family 1 protein [Siccirubricoccus deserti]MBC4014080.1 glycosyltransferase family 1 protein [Siccirubricoccus deserti]GGC26274.1 GDP-mannose-dependent alpha-mannosyltransferase [Siccirubricoccus deserti]
MLDDDTPLRLLIVTDAWHPQVNGVVRTLSTVAKVLRAQGDAVEVIGPDRFRTLPLPSYPEIRLALWPRRALARMVDGFAPSAVHIATEGPLGWAMRALCRRRGWRFTTSLHTKFPDYLHARTGLPPRFAWAILRRFHAAGDGTFAATRSLREELTLRGFTRIRPWTRGVDLTQFNGAGRDEWAGLPRPVFLHVGRVAVEKNIEAFLALDLPGSKVVVGDGPQRAALERRFPAAHFAGWRQGEALARAYAGADVLVFPSRTDTFGLVMLEAMACGTPVAAFPVMGPLDVIPGSGAGVVDADLRAAALAALACDRAAARAHAERYSWAACATGFRRQLAPLATA